MSKEMTNMLDIGDIIEKVNSMQDEIQKYREETSKAEGAITTSTPATADLFNVTYSGKKKKKKKILKDDNQSITSKIREIKEEIENRIENLKKDKAYQEEPDYKKRMIERAYTTDLRVKLKELLDEVKKKKVKE